MQLQRFIDDLQISKTGIDIPQNIDFETWAQIGEQLRLVEGAIQWCIGDWLQYGEREYGEMYSQALDATDYSYGSLANIKSVASKVEKERRREALTFAHHQEVAKLDTNAQEYWLEVAESENLSVKELREAIKGKPEEKESHETVGDMIELILESGHSITMVSQDIAKNYIVRLDGRMEENMSDTLEGAFEKTLKKILKKDDGLI